MARTVIKQITVNVPTDASIIYDDETGRVLRGNQTIAEESGHLVTVASNYIISFRKRNLTLANVKIAIVDGGLCTIPRIMGPGNVFSRADLVYEEPELSSFARTTFIDFFPVSTGWNFASGVTASLASGAPYDFIFIHDPTMPIAAVSAQPFTRAGGGVYHPNGFLAFESAKP